MTASNVEEAARRLSSRSWQATPLRAEISLSFEFFPAATPESKTRLRNCAQHLATFEPRFISVTYGAGGSTQERTHEAINDLSDAIPSPVAGHLTCVAATTDQTQATIDRYVAAGISRIVALRGDRPKDAEGPIPVGYTDAAELVAGIRARRDGAEFEISVAAYPEVHPMATSADADLENLKRKLDAGADRAITQFFFDTDVFLRFLDRARAAGITAPIVPGIMPVVNLANITNFAKRCGAGIPDWMPELFDGLDPSTEAHRTISASIAAEQCRVLAEHGIRDFHFYTMNAAELTAATCRILGVKPAESTSQEVLAS
jgi:methylenetetrahydrofolate reductase (NADPH)